LSNFDLLLRVESEQFRIRSLRLAEAHLEGGNAPTYSYLLTWVWPERAVFGAFHGLDIPLVFRNTGVARSLARSPIATRLSSQMGRLWTGFAATGSPTGVEDVTWPAYTTPERPTLVIGDDLAVESDPFGADRRAWEGVGTGPTTRPWARVLA
jgi:para-nitrobenzyl esterase